MQAPSPPPLLLVLDGNSLLHRAYHAAPFGQLMDSADRPIWALKGLFGYVARAAALLRPDAVRIGFDCPDTSVRKADYPGYKAHRPEKPADLTEQILAAPPLLRATGVCTVVHGGFEADDVLASSAAQARELGWRSVLMTSDRDAFALIDQATSVLRVRNGGFDEAVIVTADSLYDMYGVTPSQYRDYAALRGDPSDNLRGVPGFGAAIAARLLASFPTVDAAWAALDSGDHDSVRAVVGPALCENLLSPNAREAVARNRRLMRMHEDLPMPDLETARLPLSLQGIKRALADRGIRLGPSLWALVGGPAPYRPNGNGAPRQWVRKKGLGRPREPLPGQLTLF